MPHPRSRPGLPGRWRRTAPAHPRSPTSGPPIRALDRQARCLEQLAERTITARDLAEPDLVTCRADEDTAAALDRLRRLNFEVLPLEEDGGIRSYVERASLGQGRCGEYRLQIRPDQTVVECASLCAVLDRLRELPRLFVGDERGVSGIIAREDLQRAPVRLWLIGLATLIEMHLLRFVRAYYPAESWRQQLSPARLEAARRLLRQRQARHEAVDLADCLEFCDKRDLALRHPAIRARLGFPTRRAAERVLGRVELLRDRLAHAQDLVAGTSWPDLIDLAREMAALVERCEQPAPAEQEEAPG